MTAAYISEQTQGLTHTSAVEEGVLLGIGQSLAELLDDVTLQIEGTVIEQFLSHLNGDVQLVGIQQNLGEGGIGELERTAFLDPCGGRLGGCDVNLVFTGSGNHIAQAAHDVFLGQSLNQTAVILLGHQIAAVRIDTLLQDIADLAEVGAQSGQHTIAVFIGRTTGLCLRLIPGGGLGSERGVHRLVQFGFQSLLALQAGDFFAQIGDFVFHASVGGIVFGGQDALVIAVGIQEALCGLPCLGALFAQFKNSHFEILLSVSKD